MPLTLEELEGFQTTGWKGVRNTPGAASAVASAALADTTVPSVKYRLEREVGMGPKGTAPNLLARVYEQTIAPATVTCEEVGLPPKAGKRSRDTPWVSKSAARKPHGSRLMHSDEPF